MAAEWKKIKLIDFMEFNPALQIKKKSIAKKIPMEMLLPFTRKISGYELAEFKGGSKFQNGDTLLARITPCLENGKTAFVNILEENEIAFGSTEFIVLRSKKGISDPVFIYYFVTSPFIRDIAIKSMVGSSGRQRVQQTVLENLEADLPPLETQQKIAKILSALDEKIELNNKINENLHAQAQAIFKSWFVDFENIFDKKNSFFGEIPSDFFVKTIGELPIYIADYVANGSFASLKKNVILYNSKEYAYFIRNTDLKSNSFDVYVDEHSYNFLNKSKLFGGEVIISNVGDVGSVFLCPKLDLPMTLGNNVIMLRPECDYLVYYVYLWFKYFYGKELIKSITGGSAQPKFNKTDFKRLPVIVPTENMLMKFNQVISPIFKKIIINEMENKKLAQIRDTLLPKLMRGELEV